MDDSEEKEEKSDGGGLGDTAEHGWKPSGGRALGFQVELQRWMYRGESCENQLPEVDETYNVDEGGREKEWNSPQGGQAATTRRGGWGKR